MKNLRDTCIQFLINENTRRDIREIIKPIFALVYNELYVYIWIIIFYNIFSLVLISSMFYILIKLLKKQKAKEILFSNFMENLMK
jgi:hypothetical protein